MAARVKDQIDLAVRRQERLSLPVGFEPAHYFLSFAGWPMRHFDRVVEALVRAVVGVRGQRLNRPDIAAQFVRDDDPRLTKPRYKSFEKALCRFGIPPRLHKNIKNVSTRVDCALQPVLLATDRDHDFVHVPLVVRSRSIPPDAICKMRAKTINSKPGCFPAYNHATLGEKILDICRAQREPMISPDRVGDDLTRVAAALQARHIGWNIHGVDLPRSNPVNNLAIPYRGLSPPIYLHINPYGRFEVDLDKRIDFEPMAA
jgi:hypothetical protein